jgi:hypothetical protein
LPKEADDDAENETPHRNRPEGNVMDPVLVLAVYLLPGIIAVIRGHRSTGAIIALNLFLGWTVLGWLVALAWAALTRARTEFVVIEALPPTFSIYLQMPPVHQAPPPPVTLDQFGNRLR